MLNNFINTALWGLQLIPISENNSMWGLKLSLLRQEMSILLKNDTAYRNKPFLRMTQGTNS